ncbi:MAG: HU domain-containing protein [archaeon]|nr:HU domain-containing protein [archaeon]
MEQNVETDKKGTANLTNLVNSIGFSGFNDAKVIGRNDILSSYSTEVLTLLWQNLGNFIMKNYESGRGTFVKGFGTFTYSNVDVDLEGITNHIYRNKKSRKPVFLVSPEFNETLHQGEYTKTGGLIYYNQKKNNSVPIVKLNLAELSYGLNVSKEECGNMLNHLLKDLDEQIRAKKFSKREMPGLGLLMQRANILGMKFYSDFGKEVQVYPQKRIFTKKNIGFYMDTYKTNGAPFDDLKNAEKSMDELRPRTSVVNHIEDNAEQWLQENLDINLKKDVLQSDTKPINFGIENRNKNKRFESQSFFYPKKVKKITYSSKLVDVELPIPVLEAIVSCKGQIIKEMKIFDKRNSGLLARFDLVRAISKANVHPKLSMEYINDLVNIYGKGVEFIDYYKVITCLIKDCKILLKNNGELSDSEVFNNKFTLGHNFNRSTCERAISNIGKRPYHTQKMLSSSYSQDECKQQMDPESFNKNITEKYRNLPVDVEEVENEIKSIKIIFDELMPNKVSLEKNTHRDNVDEYLGKMISYKDIRNILHRYSITYPVEKVLKILKYINIENPLQFGIETFNQKLRSCKLTSYDMNTAEINAYFVHMIDVIKKNGGLNLLFPSQSPDASLDVNSFIKIMKPKTNYSSNVLSILFEKLTNKRINLIPSDYTKYLDDEIAEFGPSYFDDAITIINKYMKSLKITVHNFFNKLLMANVCRPKNALLKDHFLVAMQLENFNPPFSERQLQYIFNKMDLNKDGMVDRTEFVTSLAKEQDALCKMQDIVKDQKWDINDLIYRFEINPNKEEFWTFYQYKNKMRKIDYTYTNEFIESLYREINGSLDKPLSSKVFLDNINVYKKENFRNVNYESFKNNFIKNIQSQVDFHTIKEAFEKADSKFSGKIPHAEFCKIIHIFTDEFKDEDILKFVRITNLIDKSTYEVVYYEFMNLIYYNANLDLFLICVEELKKMLNASQIKDPKEKIISIIHTINQNTNGDPINEWISNDNLLAFFKQRLPKEQSQLIYKSVITKFDLDSDGRVDMEDLRGIICRYISTSFFKYENKEKGFNVNLYAKEILSDEQFKAIVKEVKKDLKRKNITDIGLFKHLDEDNDGFISNYEFNKNISKFVELAPAIKDKVFNYLDYYHNGLVDLQTFLSRFKEFKSSEIIVHNNNTMENIIINTFGEFIKKVSVKLSDTEIFSLIDKDADGLINLEDFRIFCLDSLAIPKGDFNDYQLERVMQSISLTKNKNIGLGDIREFVNKSLSGSIGGYYVDLKETFKETANQNLSKKKENTEWNLQIVERFAMFISERFKSIEEFFEKYSDKESGKFKYENFVEFFKSNYECFYGFNLTNDELLALFASLDSHKKNYLTLDDLKTKLSIFDFYKKMHFDIKQFLMSNFPNASDSFKFFLANSISRINQSVGEIDYTHYMTKKEFFEGINNLFPNKYTTETILKYYNFYFNKDNNNQDKITFSQYAFIYYDKVSPPDELKIHKKLNKISHISTSYSQQLLNNGRILPNHPFEVEPHKKLQTPFDLDALEKLKRIKDSSSKDYVSYIKQKIEESGNGIVNLYEFRNIIKYFNIGLTNIEIEDIIKRSGMSRDGKINLNDFLYYITVDDKQLNKADNNVKITLAEIKQLLYKYYSNPKLAFEFSDSRKLNQMDFDKFRTIVCEMYTRDSKKIPNFTLLKNTFNYVDLRKDGVIDMNEWTNSFGRNMGKLDLLKKSPQVKALRQWETSDGVIAIYKAIARSKKILWDKVKKFSFVKGGQGAVINADNLIKILQDTFPNIVLTNTQWKMIVDIAKNDASGFVEFDLFINIVEHCAFKQRSQPRFK